MSIKPGERERTCDRCGKKTPYAARINQRDTGKAGVFRHGIFWWCDKCRQEANGSWRHAR